MGDVDSDEQSILLLYQNKIWLMDQYSKLRLLAIIYIFSAVASAYGFEVSIQPKDSQCSIPLITEYLQNYKMNVQDLKTLVDSNISSLTISEIKQKNATFFDIKANLKYNGVGRSIQRVTPFQYQIANDTFSISLSWNANVSKTFGHDKYGVTAKVDQIEVAYSKSYDMQANSFTVKDTSYNFKSSSIVIEGFNPSNISSSQKDKIMAVVPNLFQAIDQQLKSMGNWMNENAKAQKIGEIFTQDIYNYDFYGWKLPINTNTLQLTVDNQTNSILDGYCGDIQGQTDEYCPDKPLKQPLEGYNQFITFQFIQNFAKAALDRYDPYKNILINSTWIRSRVFQFRLVDLEFVARDILVKYPSFYLNPIMFTCSAKQLVSGFIDDDKGDLHEIIKWNCGGYLVRGQNDTVQILNFVPQIDHVMNIRVSSTSLSVYSNSLTLLDCSFIPVDGMKVNDPNTAAIYINQFFNDMRTYTPGTYFKVKNGSSKMEWVVDHQSASGLWIG